VVPTDYAGLAGIATVLGSVGASAALPSANGNGSRPPTGPGAAGALQRGDPLRAPSMSRDVTA